MNIHLEAPAQVLTPCEGIDDLQARVGQEVFCSDWQLLDQVRIDEFARATGDGQWIHTDPVRAAQESPYGSTIAHGFLTLSLLGQHYETFLPLLLPSFDIGINYGLNRVRFIQVVRCGCRVRSRFTLAETVPLETGVQMVFNVTVELEGQSKPACVAESVVRRHYRHKHEEVLS